MVNIDDGGNAFPIPGLQNDESFNGMSLRDYFAGQALQGFLSGLLADGQAKFGDSSRSEVAAQSYQMADAMLAARKEPK